MEKDLVSIITPVYNAARFIGETIESVINQSYQNWELILVNDCSTDNSVQIIEEWMNQDSRVTLYQLSENGGAAVARNKGLELAKGEFIAFIDSDDYWHKEKLTKQICFMKENQYQFTYTNFNLISEDGIVIKESVKIPTSLNYSGLLKNTSIACSTVVINRNAIGDFRMPLVRKGQDTATWLMLMRERNIVAYGLDEVLNSYRQVSGSISSNRIAALKRTWNTYYNLEKLPFPKAAYYFAHYVWNAVMRRV